MGLEIPEGFEVVKKPTNIPEGFQPITAEEKKFSALQFANKVAQGATFGFGDEISAAMAGSLAAITGGDFKDAYSYSLDSIRDDMRDFEQDHPVASGVAEIGGAVLTGGMAGGKVLASPALRTGSAATRYGAIAGVGAVEGGAYGAGKAEEDVFRNALTGALIGSIAAPVGTKAVDFLVQGGKTSASFLGRKLTDTPRRQAVRAIRNAAIAEGVDANDAIKMLDDLGPNATLADLGENFRSLARAATDNAGEMKTQSRNFVNMRQMGQQQRLLEAAEVATGARAGNFNQARNTLIQSRRDASKPLYEAAFDMGIDATDNLTAILDRPAMKSALKKAEKLAQDSGEWSGEMNLLQKIHFAKMDIDDQIGRAVRAGSRNKSRALTQLKNDLLAEVDSGNAVYGKARELFSTDSSMIDAMDEGLGFLKMTPDDIEAGLRSMTGGERDLFKLGAVRAIKDTLDQTNMTNDATRKLLGTKMNRDRLGMIMKDPDTFIRRALSESEFTRTRNVLAGGSPTAERLAGQESLSNAIQPDLIAGLIRQDSVAAGAALLRMFSKNPVTPETVKEISNLMLKQGMPPSKVLEIFTSPSFSRELGSSYNEIVLPAIAGALVPATGAVVSDGGEQ